VFAPANTPKPIRDRLAGFILEAVKRDAYVEYSVKSGLETAYTGPDALGEFQKRQIESYRQAMKVGNVEPQ
jgi:tripartite-type tricarboxylate transporter receptor subunit TctC